MIRSISCRSFMKGRIKIRNREISRRAALGILGGSLAAGTVAGVGGYLATHSGSSSPTSEPATTPAPEQKSTDILQPPEQPGTAQKPIKATKWAVYYGPNGSDPIPYDSLQNWDMLVLDKDNGIDLKKIKGDTVKLAYIDVGEIEGFRSDLTGNLQSTFAITKQYSLGLKPDSSMSERENERQSLDNKTFTADINAKGYYTHVIKPRILDAIRQGYDGVMLDTLDTSLAVSRNPGAHDPGQTGSINDALYPDAARKITPHKQAAMNQGVDTIIEVINADPDFDRAFAETGRKGQHLRIMVNRALEKIPALADKGQVGAVLAETVLTDGYDHYTDAGSSNETYYAEYAPVLKPIQHTDLKDSIFNLEYAVNRGFASGLYKKSADYGFSPYVSFGDNLQQIYPQAQQQQAEAQATKGQAASAGQGR